jgi:peptidoglycan hydrolase-like protein with peptidoglycan-binding domain
VAVRAALALVFLVVSLVLPGRADAMGNADVAALQVALHARALYRGAVDGFAGPQTERAVRRFQRRHHLLVDGIAGPQTRRALGRLGRHRLGSRPLRLGAVGWDVSALQFLLAWHGFPSGTLDGAFGPHTDRALRRFQHWARLTRDGIAGPATIGALHSSPPRSPFSFVRPVRAPLGDRFGPRGNRFHAGIDFSAAYGRRVVAARAGRVSFAGWYDGYGLVVILRHGDGVRTWYAHLSSAAVHRGMRVRTGTRVGLVGATGEATGPHLHFEVRVRGAAVDPLPALG